MRLVPILVILIITILVLQYGPQPNISGKNPRNYYIALKSNLAGVAKLRNYVLNHLSNPKSKYYGKYLTNEQINELVQPSKQDINKVKRWLNKYATSIEYEIVGDVVHCRGYLPVSPALKEIHFIESGGHKIKRNKVKKIATGYVTREVLQRIYNIYPGLTYSTNVSVGAMEYMGQSGFSQKDMVAAQIASDVPAHQVSSNHIVGNDGTPDGESQLDMGVIWWGNGNATLWYEDFDGWMFGWATSFFNRKEYPDIVSISWGWNEKDQCSIVDCFGQSSQQYVERTNNEFMKLAAKGVTIVVSSGDAGSPGRTNEVCSEENPINPVFPGSSEWVTSVGATYLVDNNKPSNYSTSGASSKNYNSGLCKQVACSNGTYEEMTTWEQTGWTSGAGWSWWSKTPSWQQQEVNKYLNSGVYLPSLSNNKILRWNNKGRAYPDVSSIGHDCTYHDGNAWVTGDGTSCSAPIFTGIIAYLNDHQIMRGKSRLGFANPILYQMYRDDPTTFHDITVGNSSCTEEGCCSKDYGFTPTKGWDAVSGLGTPNVGKMIEWLDKHT